MWAAVGLAVVMLAYLAYRFSFTVRSIRARREGDREGADSLRTRGTLVFLGTSAGLTLLLLVFIAVVIARS